MLEKKDREYKTHSCPRWVTVGEAPEALPKVLCAAAVSLITGTWQCSPCLGRPSHPCVVDVFVEQRRSQQHLQSELISPSPCHALMSYHV